MCVYMYIEIDINMLICIYLIDNIQRNILIMRIYNQKIFADFYIELSTKTDIVKVEGSIPEQLSTSYGTRLFICTFTCIIF